MRIAIVCALAVLAAFSCGGCSSDYVLQEGTPPPQLEASIASAQSDQAARLRAEGDAAAAARLAHERAVATYLAEDGRARPTVIRDALRAGRVTFGMTQREVELVATAPVTERRVSSSEVRAATKESLPAGAPRGPGELARVRVTWRGVQARGPALPDDARGHAGPLEVTFVDGVVTEVTSAER
ncbi:MAG: hypothetical protein AB7N76_08765 [Planctomycetota bacterium]